MHENFYYLHQPKKKKNKLNSDNSEKAYLASANLI